jgi:hypothetical protein
VNGESGLGSDLESFDEGDWRLSTAAEAHFDRKLLKNIGKISCAEIASNLMEIG